MEENITFCRKHYLLQDCAFDELSHNIGAFLITDLSDYAFGSAAVFFWFRFNFLIRPRIHQNMKRSGNLGHVLAIICLI